VGVVNISGITDLMEAGLSRFVRIGIPKKRKKAIIGKITNSKNTTIKRSNLNQNNTKETIEKIAEIINIP
jgi:hypothetical protein